MIPISFQQDKRVVTVEKLGDPDALGRSRFRVYHWDAEVPGGPKWLVNEYHENYGHHLEKWRKAGYQVKVC